MGNKRLKVRLALVYLGASLFVLLSCNKNAANRQRGQSTSPPACKPYFQFDEVDHYYCGIAAHKVWELEQKEVRSDKENRQLALLTAYVPHKIADTLLLANLEGLHFVKKRVPASKLSIMKSIFCERPHKEVVGTMCIAIYRDILIFKNKEKIVGTAKICFECGQHVIVGTASHTDNFGQSGDYSHLHALLH